MSTANLVGSTPKISRSYQHFTVDPVTPTVGAEICDIDLSKSLSEEAIADIRHAIGAYGVLFFRDQDITPADHVALANRFGTININKYFRPVDGFPEIAHVQRQPDDPIVTGYYWHTDHSYDAAPAMGSIFVARDIPPVGGDTLFAGMAAAYDALSDGFKDMLQGLWAWHSDAVCPEVADKKINNLFGNVMSGLDVADTNSARHPVVIEHPISGKPTLYVNGGFTVGIDGWSKAESDALLSFLYDHASQPLFTYRHRWRTGDVAFWDNRATWHCAMGDSTGHYRSLHRITIDGQVLRPYAP